MSRKKRKKNKSKIVIIAVILMVIGILIWRENQRIVVCIDAGHGGNDVGSVSSDKKRYEKDDNLEVALKVKEELEKQNVKVILTRSDDTYMSLEDRCRKANFRCVDLFVSIHRNSGKSGDGVEIWISKDKKEEDTNLANSILEELEKTNIQSNRGVKSGTSENNETDYFVNKNTNMPSCLVELGFITNKKDNQLLDDNLEEYAEAIARGIIRNIEDK